MRRKESKPLMNRREFLNLSIYAGVGLFYSRFSKNFPDRVAAVKVENTIDDLFVIRNMPVPKDPILLRIIDDTHAISEEEVAELIEPRLVTLSDYDDRVDPYGFPLLNEETQAHELCVDDLAEMLNDCISDNLSPYIASCFRDHYSQQVALDKVNSYEGLVALPGHSQHQTGLAFDITSPHVYKLVGWLSGFENSPEGIWLYKNAFRYGFVQSFTQNHDDRQNESWHYIYVGRPIARYYIQLKVKGWDGDIFDLMTIYNRNYC
jgi:hypothetical protein